MKTWNYKRHSSIRPRKVFRTLSSFSSILVFRFQWKSRHAPGWFTYDIISTYTVKRNIIVSTARPPDKLQPSRSRRWSTAWCRVGSPEASVDAHHLVHGRLRARSSPRQSETIDQLGCGTSGLIRRPLALLWNLSGLPSASCRCPPPRPGYVILFRRCRRSWLQTNYADLSVWVAAWERRGRRDELCWANFVHTNPTGEKEKRKKKKKKTFENLGWCTMLLFENKFLIHEPRGLLSWMFTWAKDN